jgi:hypothetical protein
VTRVYDAVYEISQSPQRPATKNHDAQAWVALLPKPVSRSQGEHRPGIDREYGLETTEGEAVLIGGGRETNGGNTHIGPFSLAPRSVIVSEKVEAR